jgi:hypothetical protein
MPSASKISKSKARGRGRLARRLRSLAIWVAVLAALGGIFYFLIDNGVRFGEREIAAVDFSSLSGAQKRNALRAANAARCTCGCGMTLAQCVATDMTCPVRTSNIEKIRAMVRQATD